MDTITGSRDIFLMNMLSKTGYYFNESFLGHELEPGHPESADRLIAIDKQIRNSEAFARFKTATATFIPKAHIPLISNVHTVEHINEVLSIPTTGRAAGDAVASVIAAVDAVFSGECANAFCAVRPPGHHSYNNAHRDGINQGQGFCFFNNVAIAARYAQQKHHLKKILIVDWDFHHGNGTESYFFEDASVYYFSTHRFGTYPGTGLPTRTGSGQGEGYTFNYPLPKPGYPFDPVNDTDFLSALSLIDGCLEKVLFSPDFIFISAGFDGLYNDPLGNFSLSESVFHSATTLIMELADRFCSGHIVSVLEGGYHPESLALAVDAHMKALARFPLSTIENEQQ